METTTKKLPKAFKKKWLAALRSGKYKQGRSYLHNKGEYCCLGVACSVAGITTRSMGDCGLTYSSENFSKKLPPILRTDFFKKDVAHELANMNDGKYNKKRKTFPEIADWIQENL